MSLKSTYLGSMGPQQLLHAVMVTLPPQKEVKKVSESKGILFTNEKNEKIAFLS